jgi:hypothetical protein
MDAQGERVTLDTADVVGRGAKDYRFYAYVFQRVLSKSGELVPFKLNRAQLHVHELIERQLKEKGWVRAIILKGRQQGISTYVQGRLNWRLKHRAGAKAYVVAHEQRASDNLYAMAIRFHENTPPEFRPSTGAANAKELWFDLLDSRYEVATAGTRETGRSGTAQYLHASEYAYWPTPEAHWAGLGQTVPLLPNTEVIVESTANGVNNDFYRRWKAAITGSSDYLPIFVPWFWQTEYTLPIPDGWTRTPEEDQLVEVYGDKGLTDEHLVWRRWKIANDFDGDVNRFHAEYPCNWQEAFVSDVRDSFIPGSLVVRAQAMQSVVPSGPMVVGVDPARYGDDRTAIVVRQGRKVRAVKTYAKRGTMEVAGIVARFIEAHNPDAVFIDVIGIGSGVYDRLCELGYGAQDDESKNVVFAVNAAETAIENDKYVNRRAEMWGEMKRWLEEFPCSLPQSDEILADLTAPGYTYDSSGRLRIESKESMKKRDEKSPDIADALALTFAEPVRKKEKSGPVVAAFRPFDEVVGY